MSTLYELTGKYQELLLHAEDTDSEVFQSTLESIEDAIEVKADSYAIVDKELEADENKLKEEINRLNKRKKAIVTNRKQLKDSLYNAMKLQNKQQIKTDRFSFNIQNNPPKLVVDDDKEIPKAYWQEQQPKLNKRLLLNDLKSDEYADFKGAHIEQGESLRIR